MPVVKSYYRGCYDDHQPTSKFNSFFVVLLQNRDTIKLLEAQVLMCSLSPLSLSVCLSLSPISLLSLSLSVCGVSHGCILKIHQSGDIISVYKSKGASRLSPINTKTDLQGRKGGGGGIVGLSAYPKYNLVCVCE